MRKLLWTLPEVLEFTGVSYPTLVRWRKAGLFPEPLTGKGRKLLWSEQQIDQWLNRQSTPVTNTTTAAQQHRKTKDYQKRQELAKAALARHAVERKSK